MEARLLGEEPLARLVTLLPAGASASAGGCWWCCCGFVGAGADSIGAGLMGAGGVAVVVGAAGGLLGWVAGASMLGVCCVWV